MSESAFNTKPLGHKSYGTIGHLPGSRQGRDDVGVPPGQARICTEKVRDKHDLVIVQEKLDGTNVAVANVDGVIVPIIRAGYQAIHGRYEQHRLFAGWVFERTDWFAWLKSGERACGEWLAQAHGTRYQLTHEPFVVFDLMRAGHERATVDELIARIDPRLPRATTLHRGGPCSIARAMELMQEFGHHGAIDPVEGAVWRVERRGKVDFLAKYVRPGKVDGCYLPECAEAIVKEPVWNWRPVRRRIE